MKVTRRRRTTTKARVVMNNCIQHLGVVCCTVNETHGHPQTTPVHDFHAFDTSNGYSSSRWFSRYRMRRRWASHVCPAEDYVEGVHFELNRPLASPLTTPRSCIKNAALVHVVQLQQNFPLGIPFTLSARLCNIHIIRFAIAHLLFYFCRFTFSRYHSHFQLAPHLEHPPPPHHPPLS